MKIPLPTMICNQGEIVVVPFPFTDRKESKRRPALVLSHQQFNRTHRHTILAMITTASHATWESDTVLTQYKEAGLPAPSVVRMKLFTLDNRLILKTIGSLNAEEWQKVSEQLKQVL